MRPRSTLAHASWPWAAVPVPRSLCGRVVGRALAVLAAIGLLAVAPAPRPVMAADTQTEEPDFTSYQKLLDELLRTVSQPGTPLETRFDYEDFFVHPNRDARLAEITAQLLAVPPSRMRERSRLAWAINTYNFLVLRTATENLYERRLAKGKVEGRRALIRRGYSSVTQMPVEGTTFFEAPIVEIEGHKYSLSEFERHFLCADYDRASGKAPPKSLDPRVRFAIVPGAKSSPALRPRVFTGDSLAAQLDEVTGETLANPRHLRWNEQSLRLEASLLFHSYSADFGGPQAVIAFLRRHAPESIRREIEARKVRAVDAFLPWDWSMNQAPQPNRPPRIVEG